MICANCSQISYLVYRSSDENCKMRGRLAAAAAVEVEVSLGERYVAAMSGGVSLSVAAVRRGTVLAL